MKTDILGVAFDALTLDEAEERADALLRSGAGGYIVTANPEIVLHCREDAAYAASVNGAALVLAAMQAEGESTIFGVKHIERGYDTLEAALQSVGARLKTVEIPKKM